MGPLSGYKVIEFAGLGAAPFAAMMLGDMGAEVIRVDRKPDGATDMPYAMLGSRFDVIARNRRSLALDLKQPEAVALARRLIARADVLIEGFRPGVMERLGLGPDVCVDLNPRLVYTRVTGWGQTGPLRNAAGHDLNYIALSGMLAAMGRPGTPPNPPLNLVGDFGGGGLLAAFGTVCALLETAASGKGQVIDAAMLDGTNLLGAMVYGVHAMGCWEPGRGGNWLDGAAPYYDCYECADGRFVALAAIEPAFWRMFLDLVGSQDLDLVDVSNKAEWTRIKAALTQGFLSRTRDEWCSILEGTDACFAPVLEVGEAPSHPQNAARDNFSNAFGVTQPSPAPRFSRTPGGISGPPPIPGADAVQVVKDWGISDEDVDQLRQSGVI